ncbi:MAG: hypothetical protein ACOZQL_07225 [Myxococcota bacterium]
MWILTALVLALLALPTPFLGFGFLPGLALQAAALVIAVRTVSASPANPPKEVRLALVTLAAIGAPWALVPLVVALHG